MTINTIHFPATCTFNQDEEKRGRIRVTCVGLLGDEETEFPIYVEPVHDWGWFYVPDIGEQVEIEVTEGSSEDEQYGQMSIDNPNIKWRSARYYGNTEGQTPTPIDARFTEKNYGKRRGFATPAGHIIMFDDTEKQEEIFISWKDGTSSFQIDKDGQVTIKRQNQSIIMDLNGSIVAVNAKGATIAMDAENDKIVATATKIELNGSEQSVMRGDAHKEYLDTVLTVITAMGPSGLTIVKVPTDNLSDKVKLG